MVFFSIKKIHLSFEIRNDIKSIEMNKLEIELNFQN